MYKYEFIHIFTDFYYICSMEIFHYQVLMRQNCMRMTMFFTIYFVWFFIFSTSGGQQRGQELEISVHLYLKPNNFKLFMNYCVYIHNNIDETNLLENLETPLY